MKKILTLIALLAIFGLNNVYAYEMTYQGPSNKVYIVGSGTDEVGVNTGSTNDMRNIQKMFLYKGDIIRYIPDTMNTSVNTTGKTYTLGAGFTLSDQNVDVTSNYARIITTFEGATYGSSGFPIYQEIEITSDYPIVLYVGGSAPTSLGTIHSDENKNSWYYRSQTWSVSPYQVEHKLAWNLDGGIIYGEDELPSKYYLTDTEYTLTLASYPVKPSYHFTRWNISTSLTNFSIEAPNVFKAKPMKFSNNSSGGIVNTLNNTNYDATITAIYDSGKTVEFITNGGTLSGIDNGYVIEIENDKDVLLGSVVNAYLPTKSGYTFLGWYSDESLTTKIENTTELDCSRYNQNIQVYAAWSGSAQTKYTVTFNSNGGSQVDSIQVPSGSSVTKPTDPTKDNMVFAGWYQDDKLTTPFDFTTKVTSNITLYAAWSEKTKNYTINDTNGNSLSFDKEDGHTYRMNMINYSLLSDEELAQTNLSKEQYDQIKEATKDNGALLAIYEIEVFDEENEPVHNGKYNIKIKMTTDMKKYNTFKIIYIDINNNLATEEPITLTKDGEYLVGELNHLSTYTLLGSNTAPQNNTNNPQTADNIYLWVCMLIISISGLFIGAYATIKQKSK